MIFVFIVIIGLGKYFDVVDDDFKYRKNEELKNEYRLIKVIFNKKSHYVFEKIKDEETWEEFRNLGNVGEFSAKKQFLKLTINFITPVKNII